MSNIDTPAASTWQKGKVLELDPFVAAALLESSGRRYRDDTTTTTSKMKSFFGGYRSAGTDASARTYFADKENPLTIVYTLTSTVTKVQVQVFKDRRTPLPDILVQAEAATMAALEDMQSDSGDETAADDAARSDPSEPPLGAEAPRALPRMSTIDLFFPPIAGVAAGRSVQPATAAASSTANATANAIAGPSSGGTADNTRQRPTDSRTRVVRGLPRRHRRTASGNFIIPWPAIPEYLADIRGPLGPRPRNIMVINDGTSTGQVAGDAMQL
ncbi:hypothetical protein HYPSUDRAFT_52766 [Hypholoma sublateritium FD-334 SS-4]|uniref:Uncharacterized protein n=1 Tax=Hypholoma sublateritium (strain FD-334 SS-4) TaxID=945553 RepID=A0A0D2Q390_HYPSF|nr:hypothetical protein HYPSUDRAFT_52766 [Hypholoma sublateritium FD-334 SS-4]